MKFRLSPGAVVLAGLLLVFPAFAQQDSKNTTEEQTPSAKQNAPEQKAETPADQGSPSAKPSSPQQTSSPAPADPTAKTPSDPTAKAPADPGAKDGDTKDAEPKKDQSKMVEQPDDSKVKHDGSKNDVNAIGNRKVGGRGLGDWYSLEGEIRMGKQYAQEVEATSKLIRDPVITEYVNRIGQNLVRNSDAQVPFTIKVIDSDEVNAFALPGGF